MSGGVKKIAQVAVGAVIGFVQGGPVGAAIGAGMAFYMAEQQEKLNTKSPMRDNEPSAQTVRSSKAPARFILGRVSTGGVLVWAQEQAGDQTDGEWLHLVYVLCEGPVDALENIYLGEEEIATYGEHAIYELVVNPTQVNAFLKANCPDWKDEQIGRGLSFVRLSLKYSAEKFPSGIPDARFIVRGRNDIYDPRSGTAVYTENTALHILWYLRNRCGVPDDEIVFETFASGANICDESVANPDNTTSPRYRSSCVIGADEQRTNVLQKLEAACGGRTIRVGGRWLFQAGAYYGPYDFEITEDMVVGTITGSTEPTNDAAINTVRGTFIDTSQSWTETDYPEVSVAEWVIEDGGEAAETLSFSYVTDAYQAQRLANIELRRRRAGGTISVPMNFMGYNCRPGRAVRVNLPSLNILGEFIVTNWSMGSDQGCTAQLQQYDAAQFHDAVGQPYNPIGFIKLPTGGLGSPTGLTWSTDDNAESVQGTLSWAAPSGAVTSYAVTVRQGAIAVQAQQVPATALKLPLSGLPSGSYTMSVAALGPLTRSGEASITVSIDGPPIPESCVVQATIDTITLIPGNTLHGLNGGTYEYFFSTNPQATEGEYLGQGLSLTHTGLAFATNYAYFVRSKNAYGVSAFLKVVASTSTDVENMLDALKDKIEGGQLAPALRQEIELISGPPSTPGSVNARIQDLGEQVAEAQQDLQQQIDTIADLADSMPYKPDQAYTAGQGVLGEDGKLYQAKVDVPAGNPPPNATFWTDIGQAVQTANGLAARVTTVETKVTEQDGKLAAESTRIDGVQSSLATTNQNVNAAQQAAQDAATLAGGKGKVIVQSAAPAAADRLAQNLWIDTTGNANTPKRWNGSAWSAVTDKVATDAAAAAANALSLAQTKADATVVDSLSSKVTQQGDTIASQGQALVGMQNSLTTTNQNVTAAQQAAQAAADAAGAKGKVLYQSTAPAVADRLAQNLWIDTTGNANTPKRWNGTAWVAVTDKVATDAAAAASSALAQVATKAEASAVQALSTEVSQHGTTLTSQGQSISELRNTIGGLGAGGLDAAAGSTWQFDTDEEGWSATNATLAASPGSITITATAGSPRLLSPVVSINGALYSRIRVKITRRAGTTADWYGRLFYQTPGHALSSSYVGAAANPNIAVGESAIVEWDMANLLVGGNDWVTSTIIRFRVELGSVTGGAFEIDWIAVGRLGPGASAAALQQVATEVTQQGDIITSQGQALTSMQNSLTTTNQNVTAAQQAAQAASDAAGAKGKVLYQSTAPAVADRLSQNLWIDTTGNANTPKRWNGTAWVAVTDKVATDAAAAASSALAQVATKAEASAVQALSTEVSQHGTTLTSQGQSISELRNTIGGLGAGGLDAAPGSTWQFDTSEEGWSATNATLAASPGSITITATAGNPRLLSPVVSINGTLYSRIRVKITRRAGTTADWYGRLFYQTPGHALSSSYVGAAANPNIAVGESAIVEWDMANLLVGGNDWVTSTIIRFRVELGSGTLSGGAFEVDWVSVGRLAPSASAAALQQVSTDVAQQGQQLTAQATRLDGLYVQVNPEMEGDSSGLAGATGGLVGVWTEQSARIEDGIAMGRQVETVQAQMGQTNASVQQVSEVMADINGRVSAQTTLKVETNQGGRKVVSGIAIGSNGEEGEILLMAQRLAIIDNLNGQTILPFVVEGGQVFINQAVINTAFIQQIVAGMTIRSAALNGQGLPLLEINFAAGTFTLRGQDANGSTLLNNGGLYVYDANGIERTAVGRLT